MCVWGGRGCMCVWVCGCVGVEGQKHTRCTDTGIIDPLSSLQHHKSPWQHTFFFAFGNYYKIETACMLSTREMSKSKADMVVLLGERASLGVAAGCILRLHGTAL